MYKNILEIYKKYPGSLDFAGFFLAPFPVPFLPVTKKTELCISGLCPQMQEIRGFSDFPLFPFFPVHFEGMGRGICPPVPFLCETGIKKEQNGYAGCACFMSVKGHGGRNMHAPPHVAGRKQDATPDFPPCLCGNIPYRRHGNSGTGRIRPRRLTGHCTTAPAETQRQAGAQPRWLAHSLWL